MLKMIMNDEEKTMTIAASHEVDGALLPDCKALEEVRGANLQFVKHVVFKKGDVPCGPLHALEWAAKQIRRDQMEIRGLKAFIQDHCGVVDPNHFFIWENTDVRWWDEDHTWTDNLGDEEDY
ncbi:hypothetical protein [Oceanidesulfovibrio marinus]|uniref:Uncharacterized protein n=1 Tax=Oceanidesulfovibrio marinus TaxID=370038 RepID=A0A6P1ZLC6_9BACT|nr:hypothetical protein [Oceanidesulfovibrio marinus]TVM36582.1 hypothetical protein DQK91_01255 [Oceanidesulfovibrio marinus]